MKANRAWAYAAAVVLIALLAAGRYACEARPFGGCDDAGVSVRAEALRRAWRGRRFAVSAAVGATGMSEMVFQVAVLVGFQVIYGYLFYRLGVMIAAFMAGLAAGSLWLWRRGRLELAPAWRLFLLVHAAVLLYPLVLPLVFLLRPPSGVFMALPAVAGLMGGLEFPLAVRLRRQAGGGVGRPAGLLYAVDALGASVGAAFVAPFLIPVLGLVGICWWTALLNAGVMALLLLPSLRRGKAADAEASDALPVPRE